jgi:NosR/NirI family transcriptional regulator, nitrous oxide reductase regulator
VANIKDAAITDVVDSGSILVGQVATTSPMADLIVGYAGPSNLLIGVSTDGLVQRVAIAHSSDTAEHVSRVENNENFWKQFEGIAWTRDKSKANRNATVKPDGVSGATLTSLAMAEAVLVRIEANRSGGLTTPAAAKISNSLKFSQPLAADEASRIAIATANQFPEKWAANQIEVKLVSDWEAYIGDTNGKPLGSVMRSGPLADHIVGYQGPTELLICLDNNRDLINASFRTTFDNEPYGRYVRDEAGFWSKFEGRSIASIAAMDLKAEGIEGVSGATMTSLAVAETLQASCQQLAQHWTAMQQANADKSQTLTPARRWNLTKTEIATITMACLAVPWSVSRWRGKKGYRTIWQLICFIGLGWISGNLLSLTLFTGWIQGGIPWQLAPGLATLLIIAILSTTLFKRNVYCDHLCPHGIAQQWLHKMPRKKWMRTRGIEFFERLLNVSGIGAIFFITLALAAGRAVPTAWLEPFDSYAWRVGLTWSAVVWLLSLVISYFRPMAYCRHACPTGKLLNYVRFDPARWQITLADMALMVSLLVWFN